VFIALASFAVDGTLRDDAGSRDSLLLAIANLVMASVALVAAVMLPSLLQKRSGLLIGIAAAYGDMNLTYVAVRVRADRQGALHHGRCHLGRHLDSRRARLVTNIRHLQHRSRLYAALGSSA